MPRMGHIIRVTTQDRIYFQNDPLPVPDGCQVEPFLIKQINWDEDAEVIQFICFPDEEAAQKGVPDLDGSETLEQERALKAYYANARQAVEADLVLVATIASRDARVEMIMLREEYAQALSEDDEQEDEQEDEKGSATDVQKQQASPTEADEKAPEQPLPPELSVTTEA